jgi:Fe-S cluster biogenesis protein NfuA
MEPATNKPKIESTPNPATMIFRFGSSAFDRTLDFQNAQEAEVSPLAAKIFGFPWTQSVCLGPDFVSITKQDWVDWEFLAHPLADLIKSHLDQGLPLYEPLIPQDAAVASENAILATDSDVVKKIKRTLDNEIRPAVAYDGGDVVFARLESGKLYLKFKGACAGCPSKSVTLKQGIEVRMRELYPEISEVLST